MEETDNSMKCEKVWEYDKFRRKAEIDLKRHFGWGKNRNGCHLDKNSRIYDNILLSRHAIFLENYKKKNPFPFDSNARHGLSSQIMMLNLLLPMLSTNNFSPIGHLLNYIGIDCKKVMLSNLQFECKDETVFNENGPGRTTFDLVASVRGERDIFVETKFTERGFGQCSVFRDGKCSGQFPHDYEKECYLSSIKERIYWEKMEQYGIFKEWNVGYVCPMANYYQFFREFLFSREKKGVFVLLFDNRNPNFSKEAANGRDMFSFLLSTLPERLRKYVFAVTIQDVFDYICKSHIDPEWANLFSERYFGFHSSGP